MATLAPTAAESESLAGAPAVRLTGIRRVYGDVVAVAGIDLDIAAGEFFTMLGPSGSGKTTTLRVKQSGYGKDMSIYSMEEYTQLKHVAIKID